MKIRYCLLLFMVGLFCACDDEATVSSKPGDKVFEQSKTVIVKSESKVSEIKSNKKENDEYKLNSTRVEDDKLIISVSYGGGVKVHLFELIWSGKIENNILAGYLRHDSNKDSAEAYLTEDLQFSLPKLSDQINDKTIIKIYNVGDLNQYVSSK